MEEFEQRKKKVLMAALLLRKMKTQRMQKHDRISSMNRDTNTSKKVKNEVERKIS
jgi:hypothetical protein